MRADRLVKFRMLVGPRLEHKGGGRLELRHVKVRPTVICAFIALIAASHSRLEAS